jgi:hypothetical protein
MRYLSLFENWGEAFYQRYGKALKLWRLGLADQPLDFSTKSWEEFKSVIREELTKNGYKVEEISEPNQHGQVNLEIIGLKAQENGETAPAYLRYLIQQNTRDTSTIYLISADYLKALPVEDPEMIVREILRIASIHLYPNPID